MIALSSLAVGLLPFVDNFAHLGGFLAGVLLSIIMVPLRPFTSGSQQQQQTSAAGTSATTTTTTTTTTIIKPSESSPLATGMKVAPPQQQQQQQEQQVGSSEDWDEEYEEPCCEACGQGIAWLGWLFSGCHGSSQEEEDEENGGIGAIDAETTMMVMRFVCVVAFIVGIGAGLLIVMDGLLEDHWCRTCTEFECVNFGQHWCFGPYST